MELSKLIERLHSEVICELSKIEGTHKVIDKVFEIIEEIDYKEISKDG